MNGPLQLDPGTLLMLGGGLCALAILLMIVMPVIGTLFDLIGIVGGLLVGDPSSCCGCIVLLSVVAVIGVIALFLISVLSTCGTPDAITFCGWLGR